MIFHVPSARWWTTSSCSIEIYVDVLFSLFFSGSTSKAFHNCVLLVNVFIQFFLSRRAVNVSHDEATSAFRLTMADETLTLMWRMKILIIFHFETIWRFLLNNLINLMFQNCSPFHDFSENPKPKNLSSIEKKNHWREENMNKQKILSRVESSEYFDLLLLSCQVWHLFSRKKRSERKSEGEERKFWYPVSMDTKENSFNSVMGNAGGEFSPTQPQTFVCVCVCVWLCEHSQHIFHLRKQLSSTSTSFATFCYRNWSAAMSTKRRRSKSGENWIWASRCLPLLTHMPENQESRFHWHFLPISWLCAALALGSLFQRIVFRL